MAAACEAICYQIGPASTLNTALSSPSNRASGPREYGCKRSGNAVIYTLNAGSSGQDRWQVADFRRRKLISAEGRIRRWNVKIGSFLSSNQHCILPTAIPYPNARHKENREAETEANRVAAREMRRRVIPAAVKPGCVDDADDAFGSISRHHQEFAGGRGSCTPIRPSLASCHTNGTSGSFG